ncbi:MAG TPA: hypothetical protein VFQ70_01105, partial [Candidatus Saccharimonadaceae bacterium]|nr:hypothetical protein [Candidatus Saccharimonadaceae bacterium]
MENRQRLLDELRQALDAGVVSKNDLRSLLATDVATETTDVSPKTRKPSNLSAVDIMFYIGGIVLFAAVCAVVSQSWSITSALMHIFLSGGVGIILWAITFALIRSDIMSDTVRGLTNSLLIAGILSVTLGGFIADYHVAQSYSNYQFVVAGITTLILGLLHVLYYRLVRRDLVLLFGIILGVSALPLAIDQVLSNLEAPLYSWCLVVAAAAGFLTYVTRIVARYLPEAQAFIAHVFDGFSALVILLSLFIASRGDHLVALWFIVLIVAILGMFYLS